MADGALLMAFWGRNTIAFGLGVLVLGIARAALRLDRNAYRYAGITLAIVMLIDRAGPARSFGIHRFVEVSLGIVFGLALTAIWPECQYDGSSAGHSSGVTAPDTASGSAGRAR